MNRVDIDLADPKLVDKMPDFDWRSLSEQETSRLQLAIGLWREQMYAQERRETAWQTMAGSMFSFAIIVLVLSFIKVDAEWIIAGVILSQMLRMIVLCHRAINCRKDVREAGEHMLEVTNGLATLHPSKEERAQ